MAAKFDEVLITQLAKTTRFIQRKSKLKSIDFLKTLMFIYHQGKACSLLELCGDLYHSCGLHIRKQSIQARFNERAVCFLKAVLSNLLKEEIPAMKSVGTLTGFNRVRIKDSTRFALPDSYASVYQGHGGATHNSESMISIQYEYDLLSAKTLDLNMTSGTRNDQRDAKESTHDIQKNDLFLRDLGYATLNFMKQVIKGKAYFLNRLYPQINVYRQVDGQLEPLGFKACYRHMKKHHLPFLEYEVLLGKKEKIPARLVIYMAGQATYEKRLRKTSKHARSKGHQVSEDYKAQARLTTYITNTEKEKISAQIMAKVYGLRWQIELIFKIWKSQAHINQVKAMKIHRFECQLLARLIWLMLHCKLFRHVADWLNSTTKDKTASSWKYYKHAHTLNFAIREAINEPDQLKEILLRLIDRANSSFLLEKKKEKHTHYHVLMMLN